MNGATACLPEIGNISGTVESLSLATWTGNGATSDLRAQHWWQAVGTPVEMAARTAPDYDFDASTSLGDFFDDIRASDTVISHWYGARNEVFLRDRTNQDFFPLAWLDGGRPLVETWPALHQDSFVSSDERTVLGWTRGALGLQTLVSKPAAAEHDVGVDGNVMAWLESLDSDLTAGGTSYVGATLLTSPFATTAAGVTPKKVAFLPGCTSLNCGLVVGAGYALVVESSSVTTLDLVRLSDGQIQTLSAITTPGIYSEDFIGSILVANGSVWLYWANGLGVSAGFQRIQIDSLPIAK